MLLVDEKSTKKNHKNSYSILCQDAELNVSVRNIGLAVVEPGLSHERLPNCGKGPVTAEDKVRLETRLLRGVSPERGKDSKHIMTCSENFRHPVPITMRNKLIHSPSCLGMKTKAKHLPLISFPPNLCESS